MEPKFPTSFFEVLLPTSSRLGRARSYICHLPVVRVFVLYCALASLHWKGAKGKLRGSSSKQRDIRLAELTVLIGRSHLNYSWEVAWVVLAILSLASGSILPQLIQPFTEKYKKQIYTYLSLICHVKVMYLLCYLPCVNLALAILCLIRGIGVS